MPGHQVAPLYALQQHGPGQGRYTVRCPYCGQLHSHRWYGNHVSFDAAAPCGVGIHVRMYRVDLRAALASRDDNAMHEYENNWTE